MAKLEFICIFLIQNLSHYSLPWGQCLSYFLTRKGKQWVRTQLQKLPFNIYLEGSFFLFMLQKECQDSNLVSLSLVSGMWWISDNMIILNIIHWVKGQVFVGENLAEMSVGIVCGIQMGEMSAVRNRTWTGPGRGKCVLSSQLPGVSALPSRNKSFLLLSWASLRVN